MFLLSILLSFFALALIPGLASAQVSEVEAVSACQTVISEKAGLAQFQFAELKSEHTIGSWRITGQLHKGGERRRFLCRIDDRGRVAVATVAPITPAASQVEK
jgi:hypothetical protein